MKTTTSLFASLCPLLACLLLLLAAQTSFVAAAPVPSLPTVEAAPIHAIYDAVLLARWRKNSGNGRGKGNGSPAPAPAPAPEAPKPPVDTPPKKGDDCPPGNERCSWRWAAYDW